MTPRLGDLAACFEGVIPSIVATSATDGTPNISYLSHVIMVDDEHVALSNQFFAKTAANIRANPNAALLVVDARDGQQFGIDATWVRSLDSGPLFDRVAVHLRASSAQVGMSDVMRLRAVDIFRVSSITAVPAPTTGQKRAAPETPKIGLVATARIMKTIAAQADADAVIGAMFDSVRAVLGCGNAIALLNDGVRGVLVTVASMGYEPSGVGSEVPFGEGLIGAAAAARHAIKTNDTGRIRRFGSAIAATTADENRTRTIRFPGIADALSQIAVPLIAHGVVRGVMFVESRERLAFGEEQEAMLEMIAHQGAAALALCETLASEAHAVSSSPPAPSLSRRVIDIVHHGFDDSIFIDNAYIIKGVAGRLLAFMLDIYMREGRSEFTNREIRLSEALRLPDFKDNLETRLLLLRRRLDEKGSPVRLIHEGRGRVRLSVDGTPTLAQK